MRKRCSRKVRQARIPMIAVAHTVPGLGISAHGAVEAIRKGYATTSHFDDLADTRDLLTLAAAARKDQSAIVTCELAFVALTAIKDRHAAAGEFTASDDELAALALLCEVSEDFWNRQAGTVFATHYDALQRARRAQQASVE